MPPSIPLLELDFQSELTASTVAEPVCCVSHQIRENCTSWLPSREKTCPTHRVRNGRRERGCVALASVIKSSTASNWIISNNIHFLNCNVNNLYIYMKRSCINVVCA